MLFSLIVFRFYFMGGRSATHYAIAMSHNRPYSLKSVNMLIVLGMLIWQKV